VSAHVAVREARLLAEKWVRSSVASERQMGADLKQVLDAEDPMSAAGWNRPAPATVEQLLDVLEDVRAAVAEGDSFEGFVAWSMPDPDEPELAGADFGLVARYRIGNLQGQGGLRVFQGDGPST